MLLITSRGRAQTFDHLNAIKDGSDQICSDQTSNVWLLLTRTPLTRRLSPEQPSHRHDAFGWQQVLSCPGLWAPGGTARATRCRQNQHWTQWRAGHTGADGRPAEGTHTGSVHNGLSSQKGDQPGDECDRAGGKIYHISLRIFPETAFKCGKPSWNMTPGFMRTSCSIKGPSG